MMADDKNFVIKDCTFTRMSDAEFEGRFLSWERDAPLLLAEARRAPESEKAALDALSDAYSVLRMQDRSKAWTAERDRCANGALDVLQKAGRR